ncbi:cobalt-precorrin-6A reductase [Pseudoroseomonas deserti]|uniref:Cobalt-precorrin-6A reductase n=1 Tax=Teichococcus deserti TaxID=1817963 RepID=A0A1V2GVM8_9PROT|nr:cobalt-precorrin-6A reductase [Pseudoroseomonas deserti]ONG47018.1 cobalt-precorrin-6A reductase [Pseudoroseomonas deserti]
MRVLLLGGTTEGAALARALADDARLSATLSLAGVTRSPRPQPLPTRIGGFGGIDGLAAYLRDERIDALLDATHPFAAQMTRHAAAAAGATATPLLRLDRPAWRAETGDDWQEIAGMPALVESLGETPKRVFLTIGRKELAPFQAAPWHHYVIRSVDPPPLELLPPDVTLITATGPFALEDELALLRDHRIELLATKNSGGMATEAKLEAARRLGLPMRLLARPARPEGLAVAGDVAGALAWLHGLAERGA